MRISAAAIALVIAFNAAGFAAEPGNEEQFGAARASVERLTLLPGPHFLSPAGSSSPGHHWRTIASSAPASAAHMASSAVIESARARLDEPIHLRPLLFRANPAPDAPQFEALELPAFDTALRRSKSTQR